MHMNEVQLLIIPCCLLILVSFVTWEKIAELLGNGNECSTLMGMISKPMV